MAPEQAQVVAQKLTPATDIYGLGAILYECLTGRPPFAGRSAQETLQQVITEAPVELRKLDPSIPVDLESDLPEVPGQGSGGALPDRARAYGRPRAFRGGARGAARPLHAGQRLLLLARREPRLTGLAALLFFSLVLGFAASWIQWKRAESNADSAPQPALGRPS
jgi:serine/threonine protein kinase